MFKKLLLFIFVSIIAFGGITYYLFNEKVNKVENLFTDRSREKTRDFREAKDQYLSIHLFKHPDRDDLFNKHFNAGRALVNEDTVVSFLFYSTVVEKSMYSTSYLDCLLKKCDSEVSLESTKNELQALLADARSRYPTEYDNCLGNIALTDLMNGIELNTECDSFFQNTMSYSVDLDAVDDFYQLLDQYSIDNDKAQSSFDNAGQLYRQAYRDVSRSLSRSDQEELRVALNKKEFTPQTQEEFTFYGKALGQVDYVLPLYSFDEAAFNSYVDDFFRGYYADHSLKTGSVPYSYCFGGNKSCSNYGCSGIKVLTPSNSDVLVTIKKRNRVYRHAYIEAGRSFTFEFPNGTYQAFFYYGKGWNPHKVMTQTTCGTLRGGFISNEHFGKDRPQSLSNQILTYELILQVNGNFSTQPSNKDEAF